MTTVLRFSSGAWKVTLRRSECPQLGVAAGDLSPENGFESGVAKDVSFSSCR